MDDYSFKKGMEHQMRKMWITIPVAIIGTYFYMKNKYKKDSPKETIKKTLNAPVKLAEKVVEKTVDVVESVADVVVSTEKKTKRKFAKGSKEAKEFMASIRMKKSKIPKEKLTELKKDEEKGIKEYNKVGLPEIANDEKKHLQKLESMSDHKGHKTRRGLSQDQKRVSKEDHEVNYQKGASK